MISVSNADKALFSLALSSGIHEESHSAILMITHGIVLGLLFSRKHPEYGMALLRQHEQEVLSMLDSFDLDDIETCFNRICLEYPLGVINE